MSASSAARTAAAGPGAGTVLAEQVRTVALATRRELIGAALLIVVPTLAAWLYVGDSAAADHLDPLAGFGALAAVLGALFPLVVWKNEDRFGDSQLWQLPVDHRRHALTRVAAGWPVLMGFVAAALLWIALLTLLSGGALGAEGTVTLLTDRAAAEAGTGGLESVAYSTSWWQWLLPLTAGTVAYLISSALMLATPRPWWWVGGAVLVMMVAAVVSEPYPWVNRAWEYIMWHLFIHPLGIDSVVSAGYESLTTAVAAPDDQVVDVYRALPTLGRWAAATALWAGIGVVGVWVASFRHSERGRGRG